MMYRGHSDNSSASLSVTNVNDGYDQTGNNSGQAWGSGKEQRRTFTLSNGEVVWDMAGNVYEWVKDNNTTTFETDNWISQLLSSNGITGTVGGLTGNAKYLFGPSGNYSSLNTGQYGGLGYGWVNYNAGAVLRGGYRGNFMYSGVFYVNLINDPAYLYGHVGFRCTFQ
jgi:formylglycine-generating enzyme required for sulfatase activity